MTSRRSPTRSSRSSARASTRRWRPRRRAPVRSLHAVTRPRPLLLALSIALLGAAAPADAATYTDLDQFRAAAGGRLVDWEDHAVGPVAADDYKARGMLLAAPGTVNPDKTFQPATGNVTTASFVVPGASTTALTRGFVVEFSSLTGAKLELLDAKGQVLQTVVPGTAFAGVLLD